jgi:hypothetical protein
MSQLDRPIILIGTQRSGTTMLGDTLCLHPDLAFWGEPRHVWTWGNSYRPDDRLTAQNARPAVQRHIRRTFQRYVTRAGRQRLCEKTPSNCLRIPFISEVYPEARIILIIRDGRSVMRSTQRIQEKGVPSHRVLKRAFETPLWEWPAYIPRALRTAKQKVLRQRMDYWGPRPPGWQEWVRHDPPDVVRAKQWAATMSQAVQDGRQIASDLYHEIRYENLVANPQQTMEDILNFTGLAPCPPLIDYLVQRIDPDREHRWRDEVDQDTLELVRPHLEPTLSMLGYSWKQPEAVTP